MKKIPREYEYSLYPVTYYECGGKGIYHPTNTDDKLFSIENCPNKIKKYLNYSIVFQRWFKERMKGKLYREYKGDKFIRAYFKRNFVFNLISIFLA